jgi:hypothetical protein
MHPVLFPLQELLEDDELELLGDDELDDELLLELLDDDELDDELLCYSAMIYDRGKNRHHDDDFFPRLSRERRFASHQAPYKKFARGSAKYPGHTGSEGGHQSKGSMGLMVCNNFECCQASGSSPDSRDRSLNSSSFVLSPSGTCISA